MARRRRKSLPTWCCRLAQGTKLEIEEFFPLLDGSGQKLFASLGTGVPDAVRYRLLDVVCQIGKGYELDSEGLELIFFNYRRMEIDPIPALVFQGLHLFGESCRSLIEQFKQKEILIGFDTLSPIIRLSSKYTMLLDTEGGLTNTPKPETGEYFFQRAFIFYGIPRSLSISPELPKLRWDPYPELPLDRSAWEFHKVDLAVEFDQSENL
jgi:hypothetical protein